MGGAAGEWGRLSSAAARKLGEALPRFRYRGSAAGAASFPLGGTGCIGLAAIGRLGDLQPAEQGRAQRLRALRRESRGGGTGFWTRACWWATSPRPTRRWRGFEFSLVRPLLRPPPRALLHSAL
ncbi:MAG: hypothetical protein LM580_05895 [Thermofilum sp.]|nr:hypothetical protein [Thermofilum sp.]